MKSVALFPTMSTIFGVSQQLKGLDLL